MKIVCVGAGPAGLYFAVITKLRNPQHQVTVMERRPEGVTFGWGFAFWDEALDNLYRNDPVSAKRVDDAAGLWSGVEVHICDKPPAYLGGYGLSMGRQRMLDILVARARELDIELLFEHEVTDLAELSDADLIVASDGVNSPIRTSYAQDFGTTVDTGTNYYLWLGTTKVFTSFDWVFERTAAGWIWLHCYYLDETRSTCIVECPTSTWKGLGLGELGPDECLTALQKIFARHLHGHPLISQIQDVDKVSWLTPGQIRNKVWHRGNIALIGDAAHSTHFSIGTGTRLAIGDSVALADALAEHGEDVPALLRAYDANRRPVIDHIQAQALASMRWLESASEHLDQDPVQFAYALNTRLGSRTAKWRYYMHLATQVRPLRAARSKVTALRRARRIRARAHFG